MNAIKTLLALSSATFFGVHLHHISETNLPCLMVTLVLSIASDSLNYVNAMQNRNHTAWEKKLDWAILVWVAFVFAFNVPIDYIEFGNYVLFGLLVQILFSQLRSR